jgi:two-component system, NarL family, invasion response regulator UvrY
MRQVWSLSRHGQQTWRKLWCVHDDAVHKPSCVHGVVQMGHALAEPPTGGGTSRVMPRRSDDEDLVTVLAVDDQAVFRHAARELIAATRGFQQVAEAESGPQALKLVAELRPDLVLLDARMPGMDGVETATLLLAEHPAAVVVLVSLETLGELPVSVATSGVATHIRKQDLSPRVLRKLWRTHGQRHAPGDEHPDAGA